MAKCSGITRAGAACKGTPIDGSGYCYVHHPDHVEDRRRHGAKGGRTGGRGRPAGGVGEINDLKAEIRRVVDGVLEGRVERATGSVAFMGFNVLLRAAEVERKIKETAELEQRIRELELQDEQPHGRWRA